MDAERVRAIVKKLAHVEETVQWGENLVFWVGDKAIGGKMFALVNMDADGQAVMSFSAGPERYAELVEREGVVPAPYMARIHWVALEHWGALDARELAECLAGAHAMTYAKLPKKVKNVLALPVGERRKLVEERRKHLAAAKAVEEAAKADKDAAKASAAEQKRAGRKAEPATRTKSAGRKIQPD